MVTSIPVGREKTPTPPEGDSRGSPRLYTGRNRDDDKPRETLAGASSPPRASAPWALGSLPRQGWRDRASHGDALLLGRADRVAQGVQFGVQGVEGLEHDRAAIDQVHAQHGHGEE